MRVPRIYTQTQLQANTAIELEPQASHYLSNVLRLKVGSALLLFNGCGGQYHADIVSLHKKHLQVQVHQYIDIEVESPLHIHLGIAVSRGERMDHVMQKATELGVSEITALFSERSEVKLKGERLEKKRQHWQQIIISACEQSGRNVIPKLNVSNTLAAWLSTPLPEQKLVLHHRTHQRLEDLTNTTSVALLIGPEGGLSQNEIELAQSNGFNTWSLGPRVLRTETAPLAAITLLQYRWGDM